MQCRSYYCCSIGSPISGATHHVSGQHIFPSPDYWHPRGVAVPAGSLLQLSRAAQLSSIVLTGPHAPHCLSQRWLLAQRRNAMHAERCVFWTDLVHRVVSLPDHSVQVIVVLACFSASHAHSPSKESHVLPTVQEFRPMHDADAALLHRIEMVNRLNAQA